MVDDDLLLIATYNPTATGRKPGSLYVYSLKTMEKVKEYVGICEKPVAVAYKFPTSNCRSARHGTFRIRPSPRGRAGSFFGNRRGVIAPVSLCRKEKTGYLCMPAPQDSPAEAPGRDTLGAEVTPFQGEGGQGNYLRRNISRGNRLLRSCGEPDKQKKSYLHLCF